MSRPRKPAQLRVLQGNREHRPIVFGPSYKPGFGSCPKHLRNYGKKLWKLMSKELEEHGLDAKTYQPMLEAVCYWYNEWRELIEDIRVNGRSFTVKESGYTAPRPEVVGAQKAYMNFKSACVEFGFTPASNSKVSAPKTKKQSLRDQLTKANAV